MYSTGNRENVKSRFFGYTSPLPGDASDKERRARTQWANEISFMTCTASRFSLTDPKVYLKQSSPDVICEHITREINLAQDKIHQIENSDEYAVYSELCAKREVLANELFRLERENSELVRNSAKVGDKLSRLVTELESPKQILMLREAKFLEEEYKRKLDLMRTQMKALRERKKREMISDMNEAMVKIVSRTTDELKAKTAELQKKLEAKKLKNSEHFGNLTCRKIETLDKLVAFFNGDDRNVVIPMSEVLVYVRSQDPIIQQREWQKKMARIKERAEREFWKKIVAAKLES